MTKNYHQSLALRILTTLAAIVLILALCAWDAWGADVTWYVTESGAGAQNGTSPANAWNATQFNDIDNWTIGDLDTRIGPGDTVSFEGNMTSLLSVQRGGNSTDYITFVTSESGSIQNQLRALGKDYLYFDNLTISNSGKLNINNNCWNTIVDVGDMSGGTDHGIVIYGGGNHTIRDGTLQGYNSTSKAAVFVADKSGTRTENLSLRNLTFSQNYYGALLQNINGGTLININATQNVCDGVHIKALNGLDSDGFTVDSFIGNNNEKGLNLSTDTSSANSETKNFSISNITCNSNEEAGVHVSGNVHSGTFDEVTTNANGDDQEHIPGTPTHGTGFELYSSNSTLFVYDITVTDFKGNENKNNGSGDGIGFRFDNYTQNSTLNRGLVENNELDGVAFGADTSGNVVSYVIANNNNQDKNGDRGNFLFNGDASNNSILNCVSYNGTTGIREQSGDGSGNDVKNTLVMTATTCIHSGDADSDLNAIYNLTYDCTAFNNVTNGTGNIHQDPQISTTTWRPSPGSPVIDAGTDVGLTRDYYGKPITDADPGLVTGLVHTLQGLPIDESQPDIGAVEYQGGLVQ